MMMIVSKFEYQTLRGLVIRVIGNNFVFAIYLKIG